MDTTQFDTLTKAWISLPRRQVLGGLVAGALSPLLGLGGREASATLLLCKRTRTCPQGKKCLHKVCVPTCSDPFTCSSGGGACAANADCLCGKKPGGGAICAQKTNQCGANLRGCTKQSDCEFLEVCVSGCCGANDPKFSCQFACDA
jgi:hypothetical protein